jgi:non-canonical (house-cleaning) NTP pyrophosphatase
MEAPHSQSGYMEVAVCAIYDGAKTYLGLSPAFEWPKNVTEAIIAGGDAGEALETAGIFKKSDITDEQGAVGLFTKGRVVRKDQNKLAVVMAIVQLENIQ